MSQICSDTTVANAIDASIQQPLVPLQKRVIAAAIAAGVTQFVLCPGSRNAALVLAVGNSPEVQTHYWPEERSAAFFALGLCKASSAPVAVITTSGSAVAEMLPAAMEAYYCNVPLLLITADRPRSYRGTGAPQCAEQLSIFGVYASYFRDLADDEPCDLSCWERRSPAHLNICLPDPMRLQKLQCSYAPQVLHRLSDKQVFLQQFLLRSKAPVAIVGALEDKDCQAVKNWLWQLKVPVLCEGHSRLRADPLLAPWAIDNPKELLKAAEGCGYHIDAVIRLGGVPTTGFWRDMEYAEDLEVLSISSMPFSGSPLSHLLFGDISELLATSDPKHDFDCKSSRNWLAAEKKRYEHYLQKLLQEPLSEPSLVYALSHHIPDNSRIFVGNSLPIRHWDSSAELSSCKSDIWTNRGINGIDGQLSTFLGLCCSSKSNWAIVGDLTALYDLAAFWILPTLAAADIQIVIINNGGGKIFAGMFPCKEFTNPHTLSFEALASLWGLEYERWEQVPCGVHQKPCRRIIELCPNAAATARLQLSLKGSGDE